MKKKAFFISLSVIIVFVSCTDFYEDQKKIQNGAGESSQTRSITPTVSPVFDWTDTTTVSMLGAAYPVVLPWYNGASTCIPPSLLTQYRQKDGWEMVYNYLIDTPPAEVGKNYLIFYNKFTGILRVFYYNQAQVVPASTTFWTLGITGSTSLFNAVEAYSLAMSDRKLNPSIQVTNFTNSTIPSKSITQGWNCFDVELSYDDQIQTSNARFHIGAFNVNTQNITMDGTLKLESEGTIVTTSSASPAWVGATAKAAGTGAGNFLAKKLEGTSLEGKKAQILSGGIGALISNGVQYLLGSMFGRKDTSTESFISLTTTGDVKITGQIDNVNTPNVYPLSNNPLPGTNKSPDDNFLPSYDEALGVWSLEKTPVIYKNRSIQWALDNPYATSYYKGNRYLVFSERVIYYYPDSIKVRVNPAVLEKIDSCTVDVKCICRVQVNDPENYFPGIANYGHGHVKGGNFKLYDSDNYMYILASMLPYWQPLQVPPCFTDKRGFVIYGNAAGYVQINSEADFEAYQKGTKMNPPDFPNLSYISFEIPGDSDVYFSVTLTLYPKAPYDTTPVVLCRSYLPIYEIDNDFWKLWYSSEYRPSSAVL